MRITQTNAFGRTERMLVRDNFHTSGSFRWILISGGLLILWIGWFFFGQIPVAKMTLSPKNNLRIKVGTERVAPATLLLHLIMGNIDDSSN